jgi:hypothetical protein
MSSTALTPSAIPVMAYTSTRNMFNEIPNETILNIFSFVQPDDLENFAAVSRRHYNLSAQIIAQHRERKKLYTEINDHDPTTIPRLLENPNLCLYVKKIVIYHTRTSYRKWQDNAYDIRWADLKYHGFFTGDKLEALRDIMRGLPFILRRNQRIWLEKTRSGDDGLLKLLLLTLTPNLRTLIITEHTGWTRGFVSYLTNALRISLALPSPLSPCLYNMLPLLSEIRLGHQVAGRNPGNNPLSMNDLASLLTLPSLEKLIMGSPSAPRPNPPYDWESGPSSTTLTHLDLGGMTVPEAASLEDFLGRVGSLKFFSMTHPPIGLEKCLLTHHKKTLEVLRLGHGHSITYLRDFEVLRSIDVSQNMLRIGVSPPPGGDHRRLTNLSRLLPPSLEYLKIQGCVARDGPVSQILNAVAMLVEGKPTNHPQLRAICMAHLDLNYGRMTLSDDGRRWVPSTVNHWNQAPGAIARLRRACKRHNVSLTENVVLPENQEFLEIGPWYVDPDPDFCQVCPPETPVLGVDIDQRKFQCQGRMC